MMSLNVDDVNVVDPFFAIDSLPLLIMIMTLILIIIIIKLNSLVCCFYSTVSADRTWIRNHHFFIYRAINIYIYSKAKQTLVTDPKNKSC